MRSVFYLAACLLVIVSGAMLVAQDPEFGVNSVQIVSVNPGGGDDPGIHAYGDSTDINVGIKTKGAGGVLIDTGGSFQIRTPAVGDPQYPIFVASTASVAPANYLVARAIDATGEPSLEATGSDTDISIEMTPKGTGRLTVNAVNVPTISSTDTLTNKTLTAPIISGGSASAGTKMVMTTGTLLTTPEAGAFEYNTARLFFTPVAGGRASVAAEWVLSLSATNTLTSSTSEQALFDVTGNGALDLPLGTFFFETSVSLTSMSATSGNLAFDILGAGTAVLGSVQYHCVGIDGASGTAATLTGSTMVAAQTPASLVTATTSTGCNFICRGNFRVTTAGTIIPSGTLVTASAAVVAVGSYFKCNSVGRENFANVGPWS